MDAIGPVLGALTLPMALLSLGSIAAGAALLAWGEWRLVAGGIAAAAVALLLARPLERLVIATDTRAAVSLASGARRRARGFAAASGALPMGVILLAEIASVRLMAGVARAAPPPLLWLWAYGVATGPWTLFALRIGRFRRTLVGIRAYAAHLALWLFGLALALGAPLALAAALTLLPALLPFAVGALLAVADRDAISNVRI